MFRTLLPTHARDALDKHWQSYTSTAVFFCFSPAHTRVQRTRWSTTGLRRRFPMAPRSPPGSRTEACSNAAETKVPPLPRRHDASVVVRRPTRAHQRRRCCRRRAWHLNNPRRGFPRFLACCLQHTRRTSVPSNLAPQAHGAAQRSHEALQATKDRYASPRAPLLPLIDKTITDAWGDALLNIRRGQVKLRG